MLTREEVVEQLLAELEEDFVGLWELVHAAERDLGLRDPAALRAATLDLLRRLLQHQGVEVGFPKANGREFTAWNLSALDALHEVERQWDQLGRAPNIGEIVWLNVNRVRPTDTQPRVENEARITA